MSSLRSRVRFFCERNWFGRTLLIPFRVRLALSYFLAPLGRLVWWTFSSREFTNFTYDITNDNREYLAHVVSLVTGASYATAMGYLREIQEDEALKRYVIERTRASALRFSADARCEFARRIGWYAFARILKPRVVVETGVDKGLGSLVLCAALLRNEAEGFPGSYFGTDKNPQAGFLLGEPYSRLGKILYGDSIESLQMIPTIDLFINDSDHSAEYERREYETIAPKLASANGLILGDNCHCNDVLARFSAERGRNFVFFREQPKDHWYPGAGIGVSFMSHAGETSGTSEARREVLVEQTPSGVAHR
jgi:Methyltransferase domain